MDANVIVPNTIMIAVLFLINIMNAKKLFNFNVKIGLAYYYHRLPF
jgi:hypothetical protein